VNGDTLRLRNLVGEWSCMLKPYLRSGIIDSELPNANSVVVTELICTFHLQKSTNVKTLEVGSV